MPAEGAKRGPPFANALTLDSAAILLFALLSALYFWQAATLAAQAPFWMDEILTLWTARLPDMAAIWSALQHGAEFTPPLYDGFIHALLQVGVTGALALRTPSIVAIFVTALATGTVVRRHAGVAPAALAAGVVLSGGLFGYAVQMRPYALVTAAFACALALYDRDGRPSNHRLWMIAVLLTVAIGLHFYALLLTGGLGLLELVRARVQHRAPCRRALVAIGAAGCSIFLWLPILLAARGYSGGDVGASDYYAKPVPIALLRTYADLLGWQIFPLIALLTASALAKRAASPLRVTAFVLSAAPVGVFVFARLVSHSYADRYALAGGIGIALLFASLVQSLGRLSSAASVLLLTLLVPGTMWLSKGEIGKADRLDALAVAAAAPGQLPIVTGSGLRFFEIRENTRAASRLVFLDTPTEEGRDPTNRNQVLRWKAIDRDLPVMPAARFLCATPAFYLFAQPRDAGTDALPDWLASHATLARPPADRASLTLVHARPCPHRPRERR